MTAAPYARYAFANEHQRADAYWYADCDVQALRREGKAAKMRFHDDGKTTAYVVETECSQCSALGFLEDGLCAACFEEVNGQFGVGA